MTNFVTGSDDVASGFLLPAVAVTKVQLSLEGLGLNAEDAKFYAEVAEVPAFAGMTGSGRGNRGDSGLRRNRSRDKHRVDGGLHGDDGGGV